MIDVDNVSKQFRLSASQLKQAKAEGKQPDKVLTAVDGVSMTCHPGRVMALLGPNGAGKTTLLRMVAALIRPTSGSIRIDGHDTVTAAMEARRQMGFQTGSTGLYDRLTATETVRYFAELNGMARPDIARRTDELFDLLGVGTFANRRVGKLSTGMKQRVTIARTIIHDPQVVIFDEPTSGLDIIAARSIVDLIRRLRNEGKTVVFSTHRMDEVSLLADDLVVIHNGRKVFDDAFATFAATAGSSLEEAFINLLDSAPSPAQ